MSGAVIEFTESHMQAAAAAYNPALHEAPLVVGHPKDNGPAYGWVKGLQFAEGRLQAQPEQVDAAFAEMVNAGRFKKVSASWYTPDSPHNPAPGSYYLRHIGFLGAQPPAVKGLKSASFAEAEEGVLEFADWGFSTSKGLFQRLRDWFIQSQGLDTADKLIPQWEIDSLAEAAVALEYRTAPVAEPTNTATMSGLNYQEGATMLTAEQITAKEAAIKAREDAVAAAEKKLRDAEINDFAEKLVKAGQLLPANKATVVSLLATMPEATVISFGEGDAKTETPAVQVLKDFLKSQPKLVNFGEAAGADKDAGDAPTDNKAVSDRATAYKRRMDDQGQGISFAEAVDAVHAGRDQLK